MAGDQLQLRGGTATEHAAFTGAAREITVDTTTKTLRVHDGVTPGGIPLARADLSNANKAWNKLDSFSGANVSALAPAGLYDVTNYKAFKIIGTGVYAQTNNENIFLQFHNGTAWAASGYAGVGYGVDTSGGIIAPPFSAGLLIAANASAGSPFGFDVDIGGTSYSGSSIHSRSSYLTYTSSYRLLHSSIVTTGAATMRAWRVLGGSGNISGTIDVWGLLNG